jgi:hypothetical protein
MALRERRSVGAARVEAVEGTARAFLVTGDDEAPDGTPCPQVSTRLEIGARSLLVDHLAATDVSGIIAPGRPHRVWVERRSGAVVAIEALG